MSRILYHHVDPYEGLAASVVTSNVVDLRAAVAWSWSWYTTSGTTSTHTIQVSNYGGSYASSIATGWSTYTTYGTGSPNLFEGPRPARYARIIRTVSDASIVNDIARLDG